MFESVVIVLAIILDGDRLAQVAEFDHNLRIVFVDLDRSDVFDYGFDFVEHVRHQDRVISGEEAS